ncbi:peptidoglycan editing factor PgeF [Marinomonas algarum]|uniref:Purine nucleoside phosphorylase n=1 Tax=Marinomonas algarum TaxID=2883105 RepID=A0A9X1IPY0_9GAMM|nr:peptidoglycan editing factor PgeF [Marinomonas algarum]MCB5162889.1 peptidoglycan editing factor PgeF [Marinomonas algarum]
MSAHTRSFIRPNWSAPSNVCAYVSTRLGGVSVEPFDSLNLGLHVNDDPSAVEQNRQLFTSYIALPDTVHWLNQTHGTRVVTLSDSSSNHTAPDSADAAYSPAPQQVCAVLTADCLPVFFCDTAGTQVAVAHAGWRGLCDGVLESTLACFDDKSQVMAWLGPAIGPAAFEVGDEVKVAFESKLPEARAAFVPSDKEGKWLGNLYLLATQRLNAAGVQQVYGGDYCTYTDKARFYSYRRDGKTGRMASVIWINNAAMST